LALAAGQLLVINIKDAGAEICSNSNCIKTVSVKHMKKTKFAALLAIFVSGMQVNTSFALDAVAAQSAIDNGIVMLDIQQDITEGSWGSPDGLDYVYTAAAVEALRAANQRSGSYYSGVAWLENHHAKNNDLEARKIMALVQRGNNIEPDLAIVQAAKRDESQGGWGLSAGYAESPLESALVVQALTRANDATSLNEAIAYLVASQRVDGGWATASDEASDAWFTAEVVLAMADNTAQTGVTSALTSAAGYLASVNPSNVSSVTLARIALALYTLNGLDTTVDSQLAELLAMQISAGDWGDVLATSFAMTALAHALGLDSFSESPDVSIGQEQLRTSINIQLGHAAYGDITQADINSLTSLDLRSASVANLVGLEGAANLTQLLVNAATDVSAVAGISGLNITVDSDSDDIAEASDNCPLVSNANQANLDGDSQGDVCDLDIDGDQMPNDWENTYAFDAYNASDASGDADSDTLLNLDEYLTGTDPRDPDSDADTLEDGVEVSFGLDPLDGSDADADFDEDGLTNAEEIALTTDLNNPDTDGDNASDGDEVAVGRNPLVNEVVLIVIITGLLL
jgi:hypothetical protein